MALYIQSLIEELEILQITLLARSTGKSFLTEVPIPKRPALVKHMNASLRHAQALRLSLQALERDGTSRELLRNIR